MQEELPAQSAQSADSIVPSSTCSVAPSPSPAARLSVLNVYALLSLVRYLRVLWRLDILSLGSVVLIVAIASLLPPQLAATLVAAEVAFGVITVPRRTWRFDRTLDPAADSSSLLADGLAVLSQLLDPAEAHAELLRSDASAITGWWGENVTASELGHRNVAEFLAYIIFAGRLGEQTAQVLHHMSDTFISSVGLEIGKDRDHNPEATFIAHTQEPLKVRYRPLTFYMLTEAVAGLSHIQLTGFQGFRVAVKTRVITFYLKRAPAGAPEQPPIVFLHGIGLGLAPYTAFLRRLSEEHPGRTIVAVQYRHVSMRLTAHIPTATEVADSVASFLAAQGFSRVNVVAHSYGTLVASSLAKRHADLLAGLTLIDPVCFAMFLPHLVCNTLHFDARVGSKQHKAAAAATAAAARQAWLAGGGKGKGLLHRLSVRRLMKGLVLREMHCAAAMSRRFRWPELNLWTSEVPANTTIVLGGADNMIPVADIRRLLTSPAAAARGIQVLYNEGHGHGAFLMDLPLQRRIVTATSLFPVGEAAAAVAAAAAAVAADVLPESVLLADFGSEGETASKGAAVVGDAPPRPLPFQPGSGGAAIKLDPVVLSNILPFFSASRHGSRDGVSVGGGGGQPLSPRFKLRGSSSSPSIFALAGRRVSGSGGSGEAEAAAEVALARDLPIVWPLPRLGSSRKRQQRDEGVGGLVCVPVVGKELPAAAETADVHVPPPLPVPPPAARRFFFPVRGCNPFALAPALAGRLQTVAARRQHAARNDGGAAAPKGGPKLM